MLSRSQRLNLAQFDTTMEKGKIFHSSLFLARILVGQSEIRVAAVAPQKIAKTAVERSKIRRKIYEGVRSLRADILPNEHILIFAKTASVASSSQTNIKNDLKILFVKAGIMR